MSEPCPPPTGFRLRPSARQLLDNVHPPTAFTHYHFPEIHSIHHWGGGTTAYRALPSGRLIGDGGIPGGAFPNRVVRVRDAGAGRRREVHRRTGRGDAAVVPFPSPR